MRGAQGVNNSIQTARLRRNAVALDVIGAEVIPLRFLSFMFATLLTGE